MTAALLWPGCGGEHRPAHSADEFTLTSPAFTDGQRIPKQYTSLGSEAVSPPLEWYNVPQGTRSYVLISDYLGPDKPRKVMWIAYNIPDTLKSLATGAGNSDDSLGLGLPGSGYLGPGGLINRIHRYRLTLYALDTVLDIGRHMIDADTLRAAMAGRALDSARLEFTYEERGGFGHWWK
jgi:hypothetical protein